MIEESTRISLPDVEELPERYGEIWIKYPLIQARIPMRLGHTVRPRTELAMIMNSSQPPALTKMTGVALERQGTSGAVSRT